MTSASDVSSPSDPVTGLRDDDILTATEPRSSTMDDEDGTDPDVSDSDDDGTDSDDDGTDGDSDADNTDS